jgi:hypothetical protein
MTSITDPVEIKAKLAQWASKNELSAAILSEDGQILTHNDNGISLSNVPLVIEQGGKSCEYTLASIYLQILDPHQSLMGYRNACKTYTVSDPVKAQDKPMVVGFFLGSTESSSAHRIIDDKKQTAEETAEDECRDRKRTKEERSAHKASKRSKRDKESHHKADRREKEKKDKKRPKPVTNEQLFSNLNVVVDKRHVEQKVKEEITQALSSKGFEITPEIVQQQKDRIESILANEIPVGSSASILQATNPNKNLLKVLELYADADPQGSKSRSSSSHRNATPKSKKKEYLVGKKPVIVVPKGMTAPITLVNAYEFFCNGRFVPRDVMIKQGRQKNPQTTFTRTVRSVSGQQNMLEYEIIDNPKKLGGNPKDWERIVAVLALGHSWQFKDWMPPYDNPVNLFNETFGFYVCMEGDTTPSELSGWAVQQTKLNRDKRGLDKVSYATFWNALDQWMSVNKSELLPQSEN